MSRFAPSPLIDDRATKKTKMTNEIPENIADIVEDGDVVLVVNGLSASPDTPIGLRVSSHSLIQASPVFTTLCTTARQAKAPANSNDQNETELVNALKDDDGDAVYTLVNIIHLRNDKLPARLTASALHSLATLASKYQCTIAVGRATVQWFDHLYTHPAPAGTTPTQTWSLVESAYLLNEPLFFARFSTKWTLQSSLFTHSIPVASTAGTQHLGIFLGEAQIRAQMAIRDDIDALADTCLLAFDRGRKHHIDYPPDMSPESEDEDGAGGRPGVCRVDADGAWEYLGALREAKIYPSTTWRREDDGDVESSNSIGDMVEKIKLFREPEYDDADACEFCEDVKRSFTNKLKVLKREQADRLWGMCLDCYKAGGANVGECRYEHAKVMPPATQAAVEQGEGSTGLGIQGA